MGRAALETGHLSRQPHAAGSGRQAHIETLIAELHAALAREQMLIRDKEALSQRQVMLAQEFEHRLLNSLQIISSLLSLQSRGATTDEAADQLRAAARRVAALGRVHHRLHLLDHRDKAELREYLRDLCGDLSGLLFQEESGWTIAVEGAAIEIPTVLAIPLGFIVNELITNAAKYAKGRIIVRIEAESPVTRAVSVVDDGPGLPWGFRPENSKGLGIRLVMSLTKQIGGQLCILPGDNGRGACFTVRF